MAFKKLSEYNEERFGGFFMLRDDGDTKDVIMLYQSIDDVLIANSHYIKSTDYSGYVHCVGHGCPACQAGLRVDTKLFIPVYDIEADEVVFWDRSGRFERQLMSDVFSHYANPSEVVFRITRKGEANSVDTKYIIKAIAKNTDMSYASILASKGITLPDYYSTVIKDFDAKKIGEMLNSGKSDAASASQLAEYHATPRVGVGGATSAATPSAEIPQRQQPVIPDDVNEEDADVQF